MREATDDEEGVAVGVAVAEAATVGLAVAEGSADGSVPWQATRARQPRFRAESNERRDRRGMSLEGVKGLGKEWLAMGSPP
jgi:hypothetical protein